MRPMQQLARSTAIYGFSSLVGRLLNYLLVPFYTSVFLPADYGLLTEWYAYAALLQVLYTYGMETTYFRFAKQEPAAFDLVVSMLLVTSFIFSSLLVIFATPITARIAHPGCERYVYYFSAILTVDAVMAIPFAKLRLQKRALCFAKTKLLQVLMNVALNLVLLDGCSHIHAGSFLASLRPYMASWYDPTKRVEYVLLANLVANSAVLPWFSKMLYRVKLQLNWQKAKPMLVYTWPLLLMGLAGAVNEMLGRAMLRHWLPPNFYPGQSNEAILGIFGACYKLAILMLLGLQAFRYAAEPFFFTHVQERNTPALFSAVMHWFLLGACFILFAVSANLDLLGYMLLRKAVYREALEVVPYLLLGYLFLGMYYNLSMWFKLTDKTYYGTWLASIGALVTVVLNRVLIPRLGYWGSVWASVASYATMSVLCYYWGKKYYPISYQPGRKLAYILGTMISVYLVRHITYASWAYAVIGNLSLTLLFGALLYGLEYSRGENS
ncbi:MAG: oligosaccharide flippase family protein [Amoebophilaceae bacterium]|jgi:O-antigen/teichoic acid export membrane protein|nr:oligosaccharide flippase family protein [Amoebophilaceae bacterium]